MKMWTGHCTGCDRDAIDVASRRTHGERVLCENCAQQPYSLPVATALDSPTPDDVPAGEQLATLLDLPAHELRILGADVFGSGSRAAVEIQISNGEVLTFDSIKDMATPGLLAAELVACTGALPKLTKPHALRAVALVRTIARQHRTITDNGAAIEWGVSYMQRGDVLDVDLNDQADRWGVFSALNELEPEFHPSTASPPNTVLRNVDGTRLVRASWFASYVRSIDSVSSREIPTRMSRVGWNRRGSEGRVKATRPGLRGTLQWSFYFVPEGWEEGAAGNEVTASGLVNARTQNEATSRVNGVTCRYRVTGAGVAA